MKHTIKLDGNKALVIEPSAAGAKFTLMFFGAQIGTAHLTPSELDVLGFAVENVIQSYAVKYPEKGVTCHGDHCAARQLPCPTPDACGVKA